MGSEYRSGTRRFSSALLIGIVFLGWGVAILLHQMGLVSRVVFDFWPLILVVFGIANLFEDGRGGRHVWGIVMLASGLLLMANELGIPARVTEASLAWLTQLAQENAATPLGSDDHGHFSVTISDK